MEEILSFNQKIICPNCSKVFFFDDTMFNQYFRTGSVVHKDCKGEFNLLDALLIQIKGAFRHFGWHYNLLGCKGKAINFYLSPNELHQLNLSQEIEGGEILFVNFTRSSGNLYPIVMTSNSPFPNKIPNTFTFVPYTTEKEPRKSRISMLYFYASRGQLDDLSTKLMIDAFKSYIIGDARNMSISAQTSIEVLQYRFCEKLLAENMISKDKIRSFLEDKTKASLWLTAMLEINVLLSAR